MKKFAALALSAALLMQTYVPAASALNQAKDRKQQGNSKPRREERPAPSLKREAPKQQERPQREERREQPPQREERKQEQPKREEKKEEPKREERNNDNAERREESERKQREEAQKRANEERERKAAEERAKQEREQRERKERQERAEKERKEREESERKQREENARRQREEQERREEVRKRAEQERKDREERAQREREAAERAEKQRQEREERTNQEREQKQREERAQREREAAEEARRRADAERIRQEQERKTREENEKRQREERAKKEERREQPPQREERKQEQPKREAPVVKPQPPKNEQPPQRDNNQQRDARQDNNQSKRAIIRRKVGTPPAAKPPVFVEKRTDNDKTTIKTTVRISRPTERITDNNTVVRQIERPRTDDRGRVIVERETRRHPATHVTVIKNVTVVNNIRNIYVNRTTLVRNRYYWLDQGGIRYSYYWDGVHFWSGFYTAGSYYWCRYYYDPLTARHYWRWYDPVWGRWCYWYEGRWWWEHPATRVVYVYRDNCYYRYNETRGGVVYEVDTTPPLEQDTGSEYPSENQKVFYSNDGTRMVQIVGFTNHAHLYTYPEGEYLADLGEQVAEVEFTYKTDAMGYELLDQILVVREMNGEKRFALYDRDGNMFGLNEQENSSREELDRAAEELRRAREDLDRAREELNDTFDRSRGENSPSPVQPPANDSDETRGSGPIVEQPPVMAPVPVPPRLQVNTKHVALTAFAGTGLGALAGIGLAAALKSKALTFGLIGAGVGLIAGLVGGLLTSD